MKATTIETVIDEILKVYAKRGAENHFGEPVSHLEHMGQCAQLAKQERYEEEVILAAFFHDIGHICTEYRNEQDMDGYGNIHHEELGANFLRERGFSDKIVRLVRNHVQAKRYLCARKWKYYRALSTVSRKTLQYQGGPMSIEEAVRFEKEPLFSLSLKLRVWDELAKEKNKPIPGLDFYRKMAVNHLENQARTQSVL